MKANLNDVSAAIGLSQLRRYESELLPQRKALFSRYDEHFAEHDWAHRPVMTAGHKVSSAHLYMLRFHGVDEAGRDAIIDYLTEQRIGTSVHYIPMATFTLFKRLGYDIADYPQTYRNYACEITLPLYNGLTDRQVDHVADQVIQAYTSVAVKSLS